MNIGELKKLIEALPDDMLVVMPGSDHSYNVAHGGTAEAEVQRSRRGHVMWMAEYYDERNRSFDYPTSTVETVFVVGAG
jgi:hypothetical protein